MPWRAGRGWQAVRRCSLARGSPARPWLTRCTAHDTRGEPAGARGATPSPTHAGPPHLVERAAALVPKVGGTTLTALARALPDDVMEAAARDHGGLRAFLGAHGERFALHREEDRGGAYRVYLRPPPGPHRCTVAAGKASAVSGVVGSEAAPVPPPLSQLLTCVSAGEAFALEALFHLYCADRHGTERRHAAQAFAVELSDHLATEGGDGGSTPVRPGRLRVWALVEEFTTAGPAALPDATDTLRRFCLVPVAASGAAARHALMPYVLGEFAGAKGVDGAAVARTLAELGPLAAADLAPPAASVRHRLSLYFAVGAFASRRDGEPAEPAAAPLVRHAGSWEGHAGRGLRSSAAATVRPHPSPADVTSPEATGAVASYNVFRLARVLRVGEPVALAALAPSAAALSTQPLAAVLALWCLKEQAAEDAEPTRAAPLLQLFTEPPTSTTVGARGGAAAAPLVVMKGCGVGAWVTAVAVAPGAVPETLPPNLRALPSHELAEQLALHRRDRRAVERALQQRRPLEPTAASVELHSGAGGGAPQTVRATHALRLRLLRRCNELRLAIAIADARPSPLQNPDVLAYAIYDAMPTLVGKHRGANHSQCHGQDALPLVPLGTLRALLPESQGRIVVTSLAWARARPHLFHLVPHGDNWQVVRRDVHDTLLARQRACAAGECEIAAVDSARDTASEADTAEELESSLYDPTAGLRDREEILQHVTSLVAGRLTVQRHTMELPASGGVTVRSVPVDAVLQDLPRVLRRRIRRMVAGTRGPATDAPKPLSYMEQYLYLHPDVFVVVRVDPHADRERSRSGSAGRYFVRLTPKYDPFAVRCEPQLLPRGG